MSIFFDPMEAAISEAFNCGFPFPTYIGKRLEIEFRAPATIFFPAAPRRAVPQPDQGSDYAFL